MTPDKKPTEEQRQAATERQAWQDAQDRLDAWLADEANQRYAEAQWARGGTNYSDWYTGDKGR